MVCANATTLKQKLYLVTKGILIFVSLHYCDRDRQMFGFITIECDDDELRGETHRRWLAYKQKNTHRKTFQKRIHSRFGVLPHLKVRPSTSSNSKISLVYGCL